jgi:hypothetical protein
MALGMTGAFALLLISERHARREPLAWCVVVVAACALVVLVRGFFKTGWRRFNHVVAGLWLLAFMTLILALEASGGLFNPPVLGEWVYLFAIAALAPLVAFAFAPRRA